MYFQPPAAGIFPGHFWEDQNQSGTEKGTLWCKKVNLEKSVT